MNAPTTLAPSRKKWLFRRLFGLPSLPFLPLSLVKSRNHKSRQGFGNQTSLGKPLFSSSKTIHPETFVEPLWWINGITGTCGTEAPA
jgi:hypothetical protein